MEAKTVMLEPCSSASKLFTTPEETATMNPRVSVRTRVMLTADGSAELKRRRGGKQLTAASETRAGEVTPTMEPEARRFWRLGDDA